MTLNLNKKLFKLLYLWISRLLKFPCQRRVLSTILIYILINSTNLYAFYSASPPAVDLVDGLPAAVHEASSLELKSGAKHSPLTCKFQKKFNPTLQYYRKVFVKIKELGLVDVETLSRET